jgi:hypothetical protein
MCLDVVISDDHQGLIRKISGNIGQMRAHMNR